MASSGGAAARHSRTSRGGESAECKHRDERDSKANEVPVNRRQAEVSATALLSSPPSYYYTISN